MDDVIVQVHSAPDVFCIHVPFENISTTATNCYVIKDGVHAAVVDTGAPTDGAALVLSRALDELDVDRKHAKWFLTHFHMDHAGLVDRVVPAGAALFVGATECGEARVRRTGAFLDSVRRAYLQQGVALHDASTAARLAAESELFDSARLRTAFVRDGDEIPVGRYRLRVVATPGHTPGHLSLFEPKSRILFGGDHALFVISPSIALFPRGGDGLQAYLDSLKKVQDLHIGALLHSHGPLRDDFEERITWLGRHHLERLEEARGIIAGEPGMTGYDVIRSISWNVPHERWEDISFMQRWCIVTEGIVYLKHLESRGLIAALEGGDGLRRYRTV